jgi:hypothetical protein
LFAGKDIENRSWRSHCAERVLIHASLDRTRAEYEAALHVMNRISLRHPFPSGRELPALKELPFGGIVGEVTITGTVRYSSSPWFSGPFGLTLKDAKPLPFRPLRGALGFFEVDEAALYADPMQGDLL